MVIIPEEAKASILAQKLAYLVFKMCENENNLI